MGDTSIVVVDRPGGRTDLSNILSFNDSAAWLWRQAAGRGRDEAMLVGMLCETYEIDPEYAVSEVSRIVAEWRKYGLVEEE